MNIVKIDDTENVSDAVHGVNTLYVRDPCFLVYDICLFNISH